MKKKFFKVSLIIITCCLIIFPFIRTNAANSDIQEVKKASNDYIQYSYNFHKFPDDKVNVNKLDDTALNNIITDKKQEVEKYIKKGTKLYDEQCANVENAFKEQNGQSIVVEAPIINTKGIVINSSQEEKKIVPSAGYLNRSFGGYCDNINYKNVTINGNTARVELEFKAHIIDGLFKDGKWDKKDISGDEYGYIDLEKDQTGKWYVTDRLIHVVME